MGRDCHHLTCPADRCTVRRPYLSTADQVILFAIELGFPLSPNQMRFIHWSFDRP